MENLAIKTLTTVNFLIATSLGNTNKFGVLQSFDNKKLERLVGKRIKIKKKTYLTDLDISEAFSHQDL